MIASSSGINGATVELAQIVKSKGHSLVAVWSGQLDPARGHGARLVDISPASLGNNPPANPIVSVAAQGT